MSAEGLKKKSSTDSDPGSGGPTPLFAPLRLFGLNQNESKTLTSGTCSPGKTRPPRGPALMIRLHPEPHSQSA
ncbi:hypothetical protein CEP54_003804 [Fusarium duplospermum]|uniref:Uncharacterized protein n=1 Tax=Fusarium duplospermum TaxID=1325734 RepID=A0A428QLS8_9HYPO|nr:hypothetical protein CEP54_003804 [Fusarium duplospermum]